MMGLSFQPELDEMLKLRFIAALEPVYDSQKVAAGECQRPGELRKHVFDFADGMRLIVSREEVEGVRWLHVSVGFCGAVRMRGEVMVRTVVLRVGALRGCEPPGIIRAFQSEAGVAHFLFPEYPVGMVGMVFPPHSSMN